MKKLTIIILAVMLASFLGCKEETTKTKTEYVSNYLGEFAEAPECNEARTGKEYKNSEDNKMYKCNGEMWFALGDDKDVGGVTSSSSGQLLDEVSKAQAGVCYLLSDVSGMDISTAWVGSNLVDGEITQNDGTHVIPGLFSGPYILKKFQGSCYSEAAYTDVSNITMRSLCPVAASPCNISHATTWNVSLANRYFKDASHPDYGNLLDAFVTARNDIYAYLNFTGASANFYTFSVTDQTTGGAYLLALEYGVTKLGGDGPGQENYVGQLVNAVINNDLTVRATLRNTIADMPVKAVKTNFNNKLASLGFSETAAPVEDLPMIPTYYADLLSRTPTVLESINIGVASSTVFDTEYKWYAFPYTFNSIQSAVHVAFKYLDGNASIHSVTTCNQGSGDFPCPDSEVLSITEMNEDNLLPLAGAIYNGHLGTHSLTNGTQYFLLLKKDATWRPTFASGSGDLWDFGNPLASNDDGATWLIITGTSYQRQQPLELTD